MKQVIAILLTLVVAANAVTQGYRYQQPQRQQPQPIPISIRPPQQQPSSGGYSAVQSLPIAQYNIPAQAPHFAPPAPAAISLPPPPPSPPQEIALPAPAPAPAPAPLPIAQPHQQYLPPQHHHHQQSFSQQQQQQQQVFSQQQHQVFSQPQPVQQFAQPSLQQFAQPSVQAIPSIPQGHQQQIVQQQLSQPIQNSGFQQNFQSFQRPQSAIITKDIFIHSAPEDHDSDAGLGPQFDSGPVRKNYRIVFIKAPTQNLRSAAAALQRAQASNEEKTIIYVLSKKPDLSEVHQQLQQAQGEQKANKPEVYFIKYKTQEEAQRAQQEIQAQYDSLGGSTHISDEGIAPVTTVGGASRGSALLSLPIGGGVGGGSSSFQQGGLQQQSFVQQSFQSQSGGGQEYLPPRAVKK